MAAFRGDPGLPNLNRTTIEWLRGVGGSGCNWRLAESRLGGHAECGEGMPMEEAPLAKINNREELEVWLHSRPREVSVAFAARSALRVLPTMQTAKYEGYTRGIVLPTMQAAKYEGYTRGIVLPVFRATAVSWAAAQYPVYRTELNSRADFAASALSYTASLSASAIRAATYAAIAANATSAARAAVTAASQASAAALAAAEPRTFWSGVSVDATRVELGRTASDIAHSPLWPQGQPDELRILWQDMKAALIAARQDWGVWTIWYDDRLAGRVNDENHELAYVRIEEALWAEGPAIVNAEIKRRIDELEAKPPPIDVIPEQEPTATRFDVNFQGLIDVVLDPPAPGSATDALQREFYEETRLKAQALIELGPNLLGALNDPANRFRFGLKDRLDDISITSSWSHGNTLRIRLKAHDISTSNEEPDPGRLHPLVAETLRDVVHTWNVFIVGDPKGRELDEIRLGPQEVEAAKRVVATAAPIVKALQQSENVATPEAIVAVVEKADTAKTAPAGIDGDQAIDLSRKTTGNFVVELLRSVMRESAFAWKEYRAGIYRAGGTATAGGIGIAAYNNWPAIVSFVARNADALKEFVTSQWHNPTLVEIIDWVVRTLT